MKRDVLQQASEYTKAHRRKKRWLKVVTCLAAVVVFCTTYALILPAITMENSECEIPEHTHTQECYTQVTSTTRKELVCSPERLQIHEHTEDCYDEDDQLICGYADFVVHEHDDSCYDEDGNLWCPLPEIEAHTHEDSCYADTANSGKPAHTHTDDCYTMERGALICEEPESDGHTHGEDCYDENGELICEIEESDGHQHTDACYEWEKVLTCEQSTEPVETEPELICDKEEIILHEHTEECFDEKERLICGQMEVLEHVHSEDCFQTVEVPVDTETLTCTLPEDENHTHGPLCYGTWELVCEKAEHTHSEKCQKTGKLTSKGPDYTVQVRYGADADLPEGVSLVVSEISADSKAYQNYYEQSVAAMESAGTAETVLFARFFDIQFQQDGQKVEPAAPVSVTITYDEPVETGDAVNCQAIHFAEKGPELLEVKAENPDKDTTRFTHTQDSFSVVGNVVTASAAYNSTDVGTDALPVDYYVYIDGKWVCVGSTKTGWYGDYTATGWTNTNRDYITVDQAESVLKKYGFSASNENLSRKIAYQQKSGNVYVYSDTNIVKIGENNVIPLARNADHVGYNVYYLPGNEDEFKDRTLGTVDITGSAFYTVSVYDPNHLAYADGDTLPETKTVLTGGSATITVNALPENSGATWQCVGTDWSKVADGTANDGSTVTFELTNITQQLRITPMTNDLGTPVNKTVYYLVFLDGQWTEVGTTSPYYSNESILVQGEKYRHFVTSTQAESVLAPFGFRSTDFSSSVGGTSVLAHQLNKYDSSTQFWTDGGGQELSDGSWAIGLSYNTNGEIEYSVYYLPTNPETFQGKTPADYTSDSKEMLGNRFWSVTVRDDAHSVYSDGELGEMVQYARDKGEVTVTVQNAEGVLWSCVGKNGEELEVESAQSTGNTTFTIKNITQPVEVVATKTNPTFTVQYYANIPRFANSDGSELTVIDTSGKALPTNGGSMATKKLYLEGTGKNTSQNAGAATQLYRVKTNTELTKMYSEQEYQFESSPGLEYFNKLKDNESYTLKEIWILKVGKDATSTNREDWDIYTYSEDMAFTNEAGQATGNTILISDGAVIRLVSDSSSGDYHNGTTFYDYNISSGQNDDGRWRTGITGINIESNYGTSLNGQRNWRSGADILAFGNANCGTGMSGYLFDGGPLNKYNGNTAKYSGKNGDYGGATFGLASGLNNDGTIRYSEWIVAPKLFNDGDANGKQTYNGSSLTFDRVGDTYTLSAATLNNSNGQSNTLSGLQYFFNPSPTSGTTHSHIFTNNFWPMDPAAGRTDALWGAYGNPGSFQGFVETNDYNWSDLAADFPVSDDGKAHNWFFGMNFALSFSLTEDYEGPLEYYFFGDDDLWVFLDNQLICDIGGVHSSIGEFVNLRDYLPVGSSGQHTLSFFYTERGASGSTCYMSFTLPSVSSATTSRDTGSLQIKKSLDGVGAEDYKEEEYEFRVDLLTGENGSALKQTFGYSCSDGTYGTIKSGGTIKLHRDESVTISGIPAGTYYKVTELTTDGYSTTVNGNEGYIVSGKIETGAIKPASFVNKPYYELPETGGSGTLLYTCSGLALMLASVLMYKMLRKRRGEMQ